MLKGLHGELGDAWASISLLIQGRTHLQCRARWRELKQRKDWTLDEDFLLVSLHFRHTGIRAEISHRISGRSAPECCARWNELKSPRKKRKNWTIAEDIRLEKLHRRHGDLWTAISSLILGRTAEQCCCR